MSQNERLIDVTRNLGINHEVSKRAKKDLEDSRSEFFATATTHLEEEKNLAQRVIDWPSEVENPNEWVSKYFPGWVISRTDKKKSKLHLIEDASLKKFVFVNPQDEKVYQRNAVQGPPSLDDERLKKENWDLWISITDPDEQDWFQYLYEIADEETVYSWIKDRQSRPDWPRHLIPIEEMGDEDIAEMEKYLVPAPIKLRLETPRKAKPEDKDE